MVNKIISAIAVLLLIAIVPAFASAANGAIWTTTDSCGDPQNANHYLAGDVVYINGDNFNAGSYPWDITGLPGGASCDPSTTVASGNVSVNASGAFCFAAYTVANDDCGEYKATADNKHDNYRVDKTPVVPEFGMIVGLTTILGALLAFMLIRRN